MNDNDTLLTTDEAAERLRVSPSTLRYWRHTKTGPKSFKLGPKRVMYRAADLTAWLESKYALAVGE